MFLLPALPSSGRSAFVFLSPLLSRRTASTISHLFPHRAQNYSCRVPCAISFAGSGARSLDWCTWEGTSASAYLGLSHFPVICTSCDWWCTLAECRKSCCCVGASYDTCSTLWLCYLFLPFREFIQLFLAFPLLSQYLLEYEVVFQGSNSSGQWDRSSPESADWRHCLSEYFKLYSAVQFSTVDFYPATPGWTEITVNCRLVLLDS